MAPITTILFDCDNTLVLSEELAFAGCADLINEICTTYSVPIPRPFTGDLLMTEFVGQNFRGMMASLQTRYDFTIPPAEVDKYVVREEDVVIAKIEEALQPCEGVDAQLQALYEGGKYTMAVVSSSALRRVKASIKKSGQDRFFPSEDVYSAATSLPVPTSKPDPAIYLFAMEKLGKKAGECIAVEDSKSGTLSGTRAGIRVVGYVGPYPDEKKAEMEKVLREAGAKVVMKSWDEFPQMMKEIEAM